MAWIRMSGGSGGFKGISNLVRFTTTGTGTVKHTETATINESGKYIIGALAFNSGDTNNLHTTLYVNDLAKLDWNGSTDSRVYKAFEVALNVGDVVRITRLNTAYNNNCEVFAIKM